ncbi:hypothetical protein HRR78_005255 [Exophiala dermatitidis]|nr:hypothetical protein HRR75_005661 [Exophiala dermatitidis]KAJ4547155.1 hypothetical protein HRR78_005255 [Exophiala dermatitidis]
MSSFPSPPLQSDLPASLSPVIHLPPNNVPTNVILFLPGLGDTAKNFSSFAKALNLPDALTITLNPPFPLPFPLGAGDQWSEDLQVDTTTGAIDPDSPLTRAVGLVAKDVIADVLIGKSRYRPDHIHLFGFAPLGGVISVGGYLPLSTPLAAITSKNRTPVLVLSGSNSPLASPDSSPLKRIKSAYEFVTYHQWKKADDSMPKNRDEVLPMMQFWGRRLKSRRGVPDDAIEIS